MQTPTPEPVEGYRRPVLLTLLVGAALAVATFVAFVVAGQPTGGVGLAFFVLGVSAGVANRIRNRFTKSFSDERGRQAYLRAQSFAFQLTVLALIGLMVWNWIDRGYTASQPYDDVLLLALFGYIGALWWIRRRS